MSKTKKDAAAPVQAPAPAPAPAAAPVPNPVLEAPKEAGKIQKLIIMHKAGWSNKQLIAFGFNKSTVAIQTSARKKDPAGYDQKHAIAHYEATFKAPPVPEEVAAPAPAAPVAAPASAAAPAPAAKAEDASEVEI